MRTVARVGVSNPGKRKRFDVRPIDLIQGAEAPPRVVAVEGRPHVGGGFQDLLRLGLRPVAPATRK